MRLKLAVPAIGALVCMVLAGCATVPDAGSSSGSGSSSGNELVTPGITLKAADGSFVIYPGVPFDTPDFNKTDNNAKTGTGCSEFSYQAVVSRYREALKCGGIPVRVYAQGRSQALYGVLLLNQLDPTILALGISYRIEVPRPAIRTEANGQDTVLYATAASESVSQYAWLLWLANHPLR
jgi:hypothetical protein